MENTSSPVNSAYKHTHSQCEGETTTTDPIRILKREQELWLGNFDIHLICKGNVVDEALLPLLLLLLLRGCV